MMTLNAVHNLNETYIMTLNAVHNLNETYMMTLNAVNNLKVEFLVPHFVFFKDERHVYS